MNRNECAQRPIGTQGHPRLHEVITQPLGTDKEEGRSSGN